MGKRQYGKLAMDFIQDKIESLNEIAMYSPTTQEEIILGKNHIAHNNLGEQDDSCQVKYYLKKDKAGQPYILRHEISYDENKKLYYTILKGFDILTDEELQSIKLFSPVDDGSMIMPVGIGTTFGEQFEDLGYLHLVENSQIHMVINGLPFGANKNLCLLNSYPDAIIHAIQTQKHAYSRGMAKNLLQIEENILAKLLKGKPSISISGLITPFSCFDKSMPNLDDLLKIYQRLGFNIVKKPITSLGRTIYVHLLDKKISPNIYEKSNVNTSKPN